LVTAPKRNSLILSVLWVILGAVTESLTHK
jgi:hypothetical protein